MEELRDFLQKACDKHGVKQKIAFIRIPVTIKGFQQAYLMQKSVVLTLFKEIKLSHSVRGSVINTMNENKIWLLADPDFHETATRYTQALIEEFASYEEARGEEKVCKKGKDSTGEDGIVTLEDLPHITKFLHISKKTTKQLQLRFTEKGKNMLAMKTHNFDAAIDIRDEDAEDPRTWKKIANAKMFLETQNNEIVDMARRHRDKPKLVEMYWGRRLALLIPEAC